MIKLDIVKYRCSNTWSAAYIPDSYNDSTEDSDSFGSGLIPLSGAIPLSITVVRRTLTPEVLVRFRTGGAKAIRSEIVYKSSCFYPIGCRIRSVHSFKE